MPIVFAVKKNYMHESNSETANFDNDSFMCYFNYTATSTIAGKLQNLIQNALIKKQKDLGERNDIYPVTFYAFSLTAEGYEEFGKKYDKLHGCTNRAKASKEQKIKEIDEFKEVKLPLEKSTLVGYYYKIDDDNALVVTNTDIKSKNLPETETFKDAGAYCFESIEFQEKSLGETINLVIQNSQSPKTSTASAEKTENKKDEETQEVQENSCTP